MKTSDFDSADFRSLEAGPCDKKGPKLTSEVCLMIRKKSTLKGALGCISSRFRSGVIRDNPSDLGGFDKI